MSNKTDLKTIKKKMGLHKKEFIYCMAYGYNDDDEILYDVIMTPFEKETDLTEKEIYERYPESEYRVTLKVTGVSNGKGGHRLDEKGRREIVDWRGV